MTKDPYRSARRRLVSEIARAVPGCDPRVLEAMARIPRHRFVEEAFWPRAYADQALPIGYGQTISRPSTVARMTSALALSPADRVLEVGTGSGYQTAVLACLAGRVFSVERVAALAVRARARLDRLGLTGVEIRPGDGALGWPERAPFDAVLVTAAASEIPGALLEQLAPGGRLVIPVGDGDRQAILRIQRGPSGGWTREVLEPCRFVPLRTGPLQAPAGTGSKAW